MRQVIFPKTRTTRPIRPRIHPSTMTTSDAGTEEIFYETSIELEELHTMARRAACNASGVCNDGPLRVRVISRNHLIESTSRTLLKGFQKDLKG